MSGVDWVKCSLDVYWNYPSLAAEQLYTNCKKGLSSAPIQRLGIIFLQVLFVQSLFDFARIFAEFDNQ